MSEEQTTEKLGFQAEVQQLLNLVVHSLYSEREVFLRELISNASDACSRLRFESLTNPDMLESEHTPAVEVEVTKRGRIITIRDNGIGMTHDEVAENIGTIARSGTKRFVEALTGQESEDANLIGQFGVGFYSVFMVAEKVVLKTRKAGTPKSEGVIWESDGVSGYTIADESIDNHGTEIIVTLRKDAKEFADVGEVSTIVKKYADHISVPIRLRATPTKKSETEWELVNDGSALWTRPRKDISDEEYNNFYKSLSFDFEDPLIRLHNRVEGRLEYSALLFIPSKAPFDLWDADRQRGIKLYVRRVFIADDTKNLMPAYLRFVRGVIDSDDLPLNVSREFLQKNKQVERIRSGMVKKILGELKRLAAKDREKYQVFWKEFGRAFKEGITEDADNRKTIAELLRFATTRSEGSDQTESLQHYVERMPEKQDAIYYITADSHASALGSPHLEVFKKHDIEVLLMNDPIDEWVVMHLSEFQEKPLRSITKGDLSLDWIEAEETPEKDEQSDEKVQALVGRLKEVLDGRITDVRTTSRLTDSPACLVVTDFGLSRNMSRILKATGQTSYDVPPIMEINPHHRIIQNLVESDENLEDWAHVLFDQATLSEGSALEDPADYVRRINTLLSGSMSEKSPIILAP